MEDWLDFTNHLRSEGRENRRRSSSRLFVLLVPEASDKAMSRCGICGFSSCKCGGTLRRKCKCCGLVRKGMLFPAEDHPGEDFVCDECTGGELPDDQRNYDTPEKPKRQRKPAETGNGLVLRYARYLEAQGYSVMVARRYTVWIGTPCRTCRRPSTPRNMGEDFFGVLDILAQKIGSPWIGVQCSTDSNRSDRMRKVEYFSYEFNGKLEYVEADRRKGAEPRMMRVWSLSDVLSLRWTEMDSVYAE